jgi:hypothetical protein
MKKLLLALTLSLGVASSAFAASSELEPNNSFETANSITVNSIITGNTGPDNSEDYFVFVATKTGKVNAELTVANDKGVTLIGAFKSDRTLIGSSSQGTPFQFDVVAGNTYYIKVLPLFGSGTAYTLSVTNI